MSGVVCGSMPSQTVSRALRFDDALQHIAALSSYPQAQELGKEMRAMGTHYGFDPIALAERVAWLMHYGEGGFYASPLTVKEARSYLFALRRFGPSMGVDIALKSKELPVVAQARASRLARGGTAVSDCAVCGEYPGDSKFLLIDDELDCHSVDVCSRCRDLVFSGGAPNPRMRDGYNDPRILSFGQRQLGLVQTWKTSGFTRRRQLIEDAEQRRNDYRPPLESVPVADKEEQA